MSAARTKKKKHSCEADPVLTRDQIRARLAEIDLAQTSSIRDLEMDIDGATGSDVDEVVEEARQALRK